MNTNFNINSLFELLQTWRFWKSVLSGGTTALVDLLLLYILREKVHASYWVAINSSFAASLLVNFSLQKFWTFSNQSSGVAHQQFVKFFIVALINMVLNSFVMFLFVSVLGLWYLGAQAMTIGMLAIMNFTLYRIFVFK